MSLVDGFSYCWHLTAKQQCSDERRPYLLYSHFVSLLRSLALALPLLRFLFLIFFWIGISLYNICTEHKSEVSLILATPYFRYGLIPLHIEPYLSSWAVYPLFHLCPSRRTAKNKKDNHRNSVGGRVAHYPEGRMWAHSQGVLFLLGCSSLVQVRSDLSN